MIHFNPDIPDSECIPQETAICNVKLATAYVPFQELCDTYDPLVGLKRGTIFPSLSGLYRSYETKEVRQYDE